MRSAVRRRVWVVLAALLVAGVVAGCAGLPDSSRVSDGRRLDEPFNDPYRVTAQLPVAGASPEQIARGFIRAGEDQAETHATAKAYLTEPSVGRWRWSARDTIIYNRASDLHVRLTGGSSVEVSVAPVGVLGTDGRYRDTEPGTVIRTTFGLTRVAGQWRLDLPEEGFGVWLEATAFDNLYVAAPVHYVTPSGRELIPDTRWFPRGPRLATSLARAQLEPVPPHLAGAVTSGFPNATRLAVDSVPIESGHARVDLTSSAFSAGLEDRRAMWAQLSATLTRANVSSISISVEGTALDLAGVGTTLSTPQEVGYGFTPAPIFDSALIRSGKTFKRIDPTFIADDANAQARRGAQSLKPDDPSEPPGEWNQLTLSRDGNQVAAVGGDFKELSIWPAHEKVVRLTGSWTNLIRPAYDRSQYLWVAGRAGGSARIWTLNTASLVPQPKPVPVAVPWLGAREIVALTLSGDGSRALIITRDPKTSADQLHVAGVVRAANGQPAALAEPLRQAQPLRQMRDVVWLGSESFAVLGRLTDRGDVIPWIGHVGGGLDGLRLRIGQSDPSKERLDKVPGGARTITTAGSQRGLICLTDDNRVMAKAGLSWRQIAEGTDLLLPGR
ncbi:LpqB family beta-propeller domain-containing protein [Intrasporangium sp.]|uniref:LpqB family beta-propeller domain-containing protein n=1 Tax=Intrasporangium sp. TaxID=1925024 RepID=UPI0033658DB6